MGPWVQLESGAGFHFDMNILPKPSQGLQVAILMASSALGPGLVHQERWDIERRRAAVMPRFRHRDSNLSESNENHRELVV